MKKSTLFLLVAFIFMGVYQSCTPKVESGGIHGTITNESTGKAVDQATVELLPNGVKTFTDPEGNFEFTELLAGNYVVNVKKSGYKDASSEVIVVKEGMLSNVNIKLTEYMPSLKIVNADNQEITILDYGKDQNEISHSFNILNDGSAPLEWNITFTATWIKSISKASGELSANSKQPVEIIIDRTKLNEGENTSTLNISSNGGTVSLTISATYEDNAAKLGNIHGVLTNQSTGSVIAQANIELLPNGLKTFSNAEGKFEFTELEQGNYTLRITKDGYVDLLSENILVNAGRVTDLQLQMQEATPSLKIIDENNQVLDTLSLGKEDYEIVCSFYIQNDGLGSLEWNVISSANWVKSISIESGVLAANAKQAVVVTINRELLENGENTTILYITSNGGNKSLVIKVVEENYNKLPTFVHEGVTYRVHPTLDDTYTFYGAQSACGAITYDGHSGWLVPSIKMCQTMYDASVPDFTKRYYWSSTVANNTNSKFYYFDFFTGKSYYDPDTQYYVRCVRKEN